MHRSLISCRGVRARLWLSLLLATTLGACALGHSPDLPSAGGDMTSGLSTTGDGVPGSTTGIFGSGGSSAAASGGFPGESGGAGPICPVPGMGGAGASDSMGEGGSPFVDCE